MKNTLSLNCFEKNLDNGWFIAVDQDNNGKSNGWQNSIQKRAVEAIFPGFICDSIDTFTRGVAWYWNQFDLDSPLDDKCEYYIKAGYTEWLAEYWLNGIFIDSFVGTRLNYEFDISSVLKQKNNLLAIRIVSPTVEGIDGYSFGGEVQKPEPHYEPCTIVTSARNMNSSYGGVLYPLYIAARPKLRTGRTVIHTDIHDGSFSVTTDLINHTNEKEKIDLTLTLFSNDGETVWTAAKTIIADCGEEQITFSGSLKEFHLWDIESPYLYTALLTVTKDGELSHSNPTRFGFREFKVKDGFFFLNDRRVFVKCAHTSILTPTWKNRPWDKQCLRDEMIRTKAMGQNAVRYLSANVWPEILDLCDEIGLMVYQEHASAWETDPNNPYFEEQFELHARGVLHRDINHPSFTMFGLLNESHHERERQFAIDILPKLREEDDSRLFILSSGRWDGKCNIGSVSNPKSYEWECVWCAEDPDSKEIHITDARWGRKDLEQFGGFWGQREDDLTCWSPEQGDTHIYPRIPMTQRSIDIIRTHSQGLKPAFLSEGGHTSMGNSMRMIRKAEESGFGENKAYWWMDRLREKWFIRDFFRYGLDELYGVPEDVPFASYPLNAKQRKLFFDCVRSNPQYCGLSYTVALETTSGAGMIMWERDQYKPFMCDAVAESLAPLHWCVFVNPTHVYTGKPFTVEAVLASEDVLGPGDYPITAKIVSKEHGKAWEYHTVLTIPEVPECGYNPFAFPVFKETVTIDMPEGNYDFTVYMEKGGWPTGGRKTISVTKHKPLQGKTAAMIGLTEKTMTWLSKNGVEEDSDSNLILVGEMPDDDSAWEKLYDRVRDGATAVLLCPETLLKDVDEPFDYNVYVPERLPFENKGKLTYEDNWHYHTYGAAKAHPYFKGLPKGLMDDDYYMLATPQFVFFEQDVPEETAALSIGLPYYTHETEGTSGYIFGVALGAYKLGKGRLVLNCFKLFDQYGDSPSHDNLGKNPAADRLLMNIIEHETEQAQ
ncbi:MAG: hypothetical protein IJE51_03710 [Clostridia bacterium]|nr:hypothetical protein [Clostridia bacterium]